MSTAAATPSPYGGEMVTTTCYMCACRCGIRVHRHGERIRFIDGNPEHPVNRGVVCAKGSAGAMQQASPAKLRAPLRRVGPRGSGEFVEIGWDEALTLISDRLRAIRARNPDELAFYTGRDQSQALTAWWAQQFGTVNYAAHGGFCSVNMAAAGMYTLGGSFWEFGEPDFEHARYLMLWGVAEDHDSNPIKIGLGKLKARGAKIVAINPVRTGYGAVADEWIGIRPGTDGLLIGALIHELLSAGRVDVEFLVRYTDAHWLVIDAQGSADDGLFARDEAGEPLCAAVEGHGIDIVPARRRDVSVRLAGEFRLRDGRTARPAFDGLARRFGDAAWSPDAVAEHCGVEPATIRRLARELARAAFDEPLVLAQPWTDTDGVEHATMVGRPVAMHAMRGISAHANGFQTCRMLHVLQMLLGAIDSPGSFRYQPPYPRPAPPPSKPGRTRDARGVLDALPLGYPTAPGDLLVDAKGEPQRIDRAYSWEHPLAAHGLMHAVIRGAWARDPYPIDTLFLFMANMGWNSAMATRETQAMLCDRDERGEYRIPFIVYVDAYRSETIDYADLVLPDTTYFERWDAMSLLDRPISDADGAADAIRQPILALDRDVRPFQDVLLELGARLGLPGMVTESGAPAYPGGYADFIVNHERAPGVGLLAGWRGDGSAHGKGAPSATQLDAYVANGCFWRHEVPARGRYFKMANRDYLDWAQAMGFLGRAAPVTLHLYVETLQRFRNAARGHGAVQPPERLRARIERWFDPLPDWYAAFAPEAAEFPLAALTQRPMFMYHAWHSHNRWLRQIAARNLLYVHPRTAAGHGLAEGDLVAIESPQGEVRARIATHEGVQPDTVWTWNAIGKRRRAWALADGAPEQREGFLLNPLIADRMPRHADPALASHDSGRAPAEQVSLKDFVLNADPITGQAAPAARVSMKDFVLNADPITGQAAWYDLRVRLRRIEAADRARLDERNPG